MKLIKPTVELIWITPNAEQNIELAGRVCYKSEDNLTEDSYKYFIKHIVNRGHDSVLEHSCASFRIICDRGISQELTRHRVVSFSMESSRYCNYTNEKFNNEISVIEPNNLTVLQNRNFITHMQRCEDLYKYLIGENIKPEIARSILPTCLKTELIMTTNLREWRHIIKLRTSKQAHPQIKEIMNMVLNILYDNCPVVFEDLKEERN